MLALKVGKKNAQKAKIALAAAGAFAQGFKVKGGRDYVYFPASKRIPLKFEHSFVNAEFTSVERKKSLKELIAESHSGGSRSKLSIASSYDLIGDIAVLEVAGNSAEAKKIARMLLKSNPRVKTVVRKASERKGRFRLKEYEWLAGTRTFTALHKENGCVFKIDLPGAYFSSRLSSERQRVASLAKSGERVLALFAGVGPFPIVLAKQKNVEIKAVELNPKAVALMRENVTLNKLEGKIEVFEGDALAYAKKFGPWADRILMTLPRGSEKFLDAVVANARKGCVVHYYNVGGEKEGLYGQALAGVKSACAKHGRKFKILCKKKVLPYAPRVFSIVVDFSLS